MKIHDYKTQGGKNVIKEYLSSLPKDECTRGYQIRHNMFEDVTEIIMTEEAEAVRQACEEDPKIRQQVEEFEAEFHIRLMLVKARKSRGMTQKDIQEATGLKQQAISRIEKDNDISPSLRSVVKYAKSIGYRIVLEPDEAVKHQ